MSNIIPTTIVKISDYSTAMYGSRPQMVGERILIITRIMYWYESPNWRLTGLPDYLETILITSAATMHINYEQQSN